MTLATILKVLHPDQLVPEWGAGVEWGFQGREDADGHRAGDERQDPEGAGDGPDLDQAPAPGDTAPAVHDREGEAELRPVDRRKYLSHKFPHLTLP